jgi:hypothetical protein
MGAAGVTLRSLARLLELTEDPSDEIRCSALRKERPKERTEVRALPT